MENKIQPRVLIIDDEAMVRETIQNVLESANCAVLTAKNGEEGLQICAENSLDLVITDIMMPGKDGIETISHLKLANPDLSILAISGGGLGMKLPVLEIADKLGADRVLSKPFHNQLLLDTVAELVTPTT
jgi:CheY-like chemotaxis protein